jgi:DNA replication licensing factor MCM6
VKSHPRHCSPIGREFFVSLYNLPRVDSIREIHTDRIGDLLSLTPPLTPPLLSSGRLVAITGTVTRSSEVRPELILGTFTCSKCGAIHELVEQQCQFTLPPICRNSQCSSRDFQLLPDQSTFVDWQTLRVQENADEIPAGSMPRCIDVICRCLPSPPRDPTRPPSSSQE